MCIYLFERGSVVWYICVSMHVCTYKMFRTKDITTLLCGHVKMWNMATNVSYRSLNLICYSRTGDHLYLYLFLEVCGFKVSESS